MKYEKNAFINYTKRRWLRHYTTSPKVMGSISNEVVGFFN